MEDNDDVFNDFKEKVSSKSDHKKHRKEPPDKKELSEEEIKKKRYTEEKLAIKEKYRKAIESLEERRKKDLEKDGGKPNGTSSIERIAYITVLIVLAAYIIVDLSFYHGNNVDVEEEVTAAIGAAEQEDNTSGEVAQEQLQEEPKKEEPIAEEKAEETMGLSGVIALTLDEIITNIDPDVEDKGEISTVMFTIDNGKDKVLTPIVNVYAYDTELDEVYIIKPRGTYTYLAGIKPGDRHTGSIDLSPKIFKNLDIKKTVRIELNGTGEGFIQAKSKSILIT
jgi:hypothetical protein